MSNTAKTVYERKDSLKKARKEIKHSLPFKAVPYALFFLFALYVDYKSIFPFQDLVLRTSEEIAFYLTLAIVFAIDVLIPISLTKLVQAHYNQKKLKTILILSILCSIRIPMVLLVVQKMMGTDVMIPDRGTTATVTEPVKIVTQLLFAFIPIATTVGLTVMGLLRENIKIFRKYRYLQLVKADIEAEKDHIEEALNSDLATLAERDDSKFISAVTELFAMRDTLFTKAREILAMSIGSPAATEQIVNSEPVYRASDQYKYITKHLMLNPAIKVVFEEDKKEESTTSSISNNNVSIFEKEDIHNEKESA